MKVKNLLTVCGACRCSDVERRQHLRAKWRRWRIGGGGCGGGGGGFGGGRNFDPAQMQQRMMDNYPPAT